MNLLDFDTIILDLDNTIWHGNKPGIWAKTIGHNWTLSDDIIHGEGNFIKFDKEIAPILENKLQNKNLGFLTRGGLLNTLWEDQPVIRCLKFFGIYNFFKYHSYVLYMTDLKSRVFVPSGKTIFIDDDPRDLQDISNNYPDVTCLNRNTFNKWTEIIN